MLGFLRKYCVLARNLAKYQNLISLPPNVKKILPQLSLQSVADPENFGGGGFEAQNLKNSDVFTKIESDFSAEIGNSNVFFVQIQVVSNKKKKKKKKKVFTKIETDFSPDSLRLGRWGGMHPEMEPNYSKQRLIFRPKSLLLGWWGGMHPPP